MIEKLIKLNQNKFIGGTKIYQIILRYYLNKRSIQDERNTRSESI